MTLQEKLHYIRVEVDKHATRMPEAKKTIDQHHDLFERFRNTNEIMQKLYAETRDNIRYSIRLDSHIP